jgi:UDP-glucose 4-epimerase
MSTVVVTGAAGYIGGQTALMLADSGHRVVGIDRSPCPPHLKSAFDDYVEQDFAHKDALVKLLIHDPRAIIHCAGTSLVGPSVKNPKEYWNNNIEKNIQFLDRICDIPADHRPKIIFSSSASVYGNPIMTPCHEVDPCEPISPYGETKKAMEWILEDYKVAYGLEYIAFRYFNACGADSKIQHGQATGATHIIARVLESLRDGQEFTLNGINYSTPDGTCVRDYIHVEDIAQAHILAVDAEIPSGVYNLGSNTGTSNQEIISTAEKITGLKLNVKSGPQRDGDPAILTASADKFSSLTNWVKQFSIDDIIKHAWFWYNRQQ